jgi:hypothetical protein
MSNEIDFLRKFAAAASNSGFGVPIFRLDGNVGEYRRAGKAKDDGVLNGQQLAADPGDALTGWVRFVDKKPNYIVGRVADGYEPPAREELEPLPDANDKDCWQRTDLLPFWNPESHEVLLFSAGNLGSRSAVAKLIGAYANNTAAHPEDSNKVPLIELAAASYVNKRGKKIYTPLFDVVDWIERPAAVRRILPPPITTLDLTALPAPAAKQPANDFDGNEIPF